MLLVRRADDSAFIEAAIWQHAGAVEVHASVDDVYVPSDSSAADVGVRCTAVKSMRHFCPALAG